MSPVRVLVVDDSLTMRGLISAALRSDPEIEVVGTAADPIEARAAIKALNPDVVTLDVEMPNMNGLEFLEKIMRLRPMPVVMVSTLTAAGTDVTLAALEIGAVDAVAKPAVAGPGAFHELIGKVKTAARSRVRARGDTPAAAQAPGAYRPAPDHVLAIGSSTGGVEALLTVLSGFPADSPATVITQHMPASFTASFAARLDRVCAPRVTEAVDGAPVQPGHIYLAPGGATHLEVSPGLTPRCRLIPSDPVNGHRPSVDVLFESVVRLKRPDDGRHPDRHGPRRGQGPFGHAPGRRPHPGPGRGVLRRLWHAQGRLRTGRRGAATAAAPPVPLHSRTVRRPGRTISRLTGSVPMPVAASLQCLVVDDQMTMRSLVRTSLQQLGVRDIREASDGEIALREVVTKPAHLIISDYNMPNLDGLGLLRAVRAHPPTSKIAFIMLTGRADRELVQRAVQFGVNNYLVKPFTAAQLKGKLEAVFGPLT